MTNTPFSLQDKRILITGASSGIGRAVSILCSALGATCVITGRNETRLTETYNHLFGEGHFLQVAELTEENCKILVANAVETMGPINGFVHCAGIEKTLPFRSTEIADLREIMAINIEAYWVIAQEILKKRHHVDGALSIVGISSVAAAAAAGKTAYSASKGAMISLTKSLAAEYAHKRIRFNCVSPGYIDTPMLENVKKLYANTEEFNHSIVSKHPLGLGEAQDVANSIAYLLSDASKWVTGTVLTVDGGYGIR